MRSTKNAMAIFALVTIICDNFEGPVNLVGDIKCYYDKDNDLYMIQFAEDKPIIASNIIDNQPLAEKVFYSIIQTGREKPEFDVKVRQALEAAQQAA